MQGKETMTLVTGNIRYQCTKVITLMTRCPGLWHLWYISIN